MYMKNVLLVLLFLSTLPVMGMGRPPCEVYRATSPVMIDGVLDESCWKTATPYRVDYEHGKLGVLSTQAMMVVKYAWDDQYLYLGYETFDTNLLAEGTGQMDGPAGNRREACQIWTKSGVDCVEFFLSWGSERYLWELHHNASNNFIDVWCVVHAENDPITQYAGWEYGIRLCRNEYLVDDPPATVAMAVRLKPKVDGSPSTVNDPSDCDTGYTAEIRIPWLATGIAWDRAVVGPVVAKGRRPPRIPGRWNVEGAELWLLSVVQDSDSHNRYHHSSPRFAGGWFHRNASTWPRLVFCANPKP